MAFTDEEKLYWSKLAFTGKINDTNTWTQMKGFIDNITTSQLKAVIKNKLDNWGVEYEDRATDNTSKSTDLGDLSDEYDGEWI